MVAGGRGPLPRRRAGLAATEPAARLRRPGQATARPRGRRAPRRSTRPRRPAISSVSRSGWMRSSRIESASSSRAFGHLVGEHRRRRRTGARGRGGGRCTSAGAVSVRRSLRAARRGRRTGPAAARRSGPGPGARGRAATSPSRQRRASGTARAPRRTSLHDRLAERQRDHQRREGERAAEQRVVEHRHLDHHAAHALGRRGGDLERGVGAERRARDDGLARRRGGRAARRPARRSAASSTRHMSTRAVGARRGRAGRASRRGCRARRAPSASGRCIFCEAAGRAAGRTVRGSPRRPSSVVSAERGAPFRAAKCWPSDIQRTRQP